MVYVDDAPDIENQMDDDEILEYDEEEDLEKGTYEEEPDPTFYSPRPEYATNTEKLDDSERKPIDDRGIGFLNNKSIDAQVNRGNVGKLTADQLEERCELHARRISLGHPTVKAIVNHWHNKYGISMVRESEFEWCRNNRERIEQKRMDMESDGRIKVHKSSNAKLSVTISVACEKNCNIIDRTKIRIDRMLNDKFLDADLYSQVGLTAEQYHALDGKSKSEKRDDIEFIIKIQRAKYDQLKLVSELNIKHSTMMSELIKQAKGLMDGDMTFKPDIKRALIKSNLRDLKKNILDNEMNFDPLKPVNDDQRIKD